MIGGLASGLDTPAFPGDQRSREENGPRGAKPWEGQRHFVGVKPIPAKRVNVHLLFYSSKMDGQRHPPRYEVQLRRTG